MAMNYAYWYAVIDTTTNMCISVRDTTVNYSDDELPSNWVRLEAPDPEYLAKFYINGNWYEDAEGTIPWTSELL